MSTRGIYTFYDDQDHFNVYRHSDNYPSGAWEAIQNALKLAWELPRYEADEFACSFIAANKNWLQFATKKQKDLYKNMNEHSLFGGCLRLLHDGRPSEVAPPDIEYRYEIRCLDGELYIKAFDTNYWDEPRKEKQIFIGSFDKFKEFVKKCKAG